MMITEDHVGIFNTVLFFFPSSSISFRYFGSLFMFLHLQLRTVALSCWSKSLICHLLSLVGAGASFAKTLKIVDDLFSYYLIMLPGKLLDKGVLDYWTPQEEKRFKQKPFF